VLASCWIGGLLSARRPDILHAALSFLFLAAAFLAQEPVKLLLFSLRKSPSFRRRNISRLACSALVTLASGTWLFGHHPELLYLLLPASIFVSAYLWLRSRRGDMADLAVIGFLTLSLAAPFKAIACVPTTDMLHPLELWIATSLFFVGSSLNVRVRLKKEPALRLSMRFHVAAIVFATALAVFTHASWIPAASVALSFARMLWIASDINRFSKLRLRRIGFEEAGLCLGFLAMIAAS